MRVQNCQWTDKVHWCDWEENLSVNQKVKDVTKINYF